jgi:PAS domain S-box-containing protein
MGAALGPAAAADVPGGYASLFWFAFEKSTAPMFVRDLERRFRRVNRAAVRRFDWDADALLGHRSDEVVASNEWKRLDGDWRELMRRGESTGEREIVMGSGRHTRMQFANRVANFDDERLVLTVALDLHDVPVRLRGAKGTQGQALTPRELEIIHHVALGKRAHEIADELVLAPSTVQTHIRNAMNKVGARSQAQLVAITLCHQILDADMLQRARSQSAQSA